MAMIITGVANTGGSIASLNRLARCSGWTRRLKEPLTPRGICLMAFLKSYAKQPVRVESAASDYRRATSRRRVGNPRPRQQTARRPLHAIGGDEGRGDVQLAGAAADLRDVVGRHRLCHCSVG